MDEITIEQKRTQSMTWWVGMAACVAQGVCAVLVATGCMTEVVAGAVMGAFAGIMSYFNTNNPSLRGRL